jgi:RNA polymerase-binding transcription factor DksA
MKSHTHPQNEHQEPLDYLERIRLAMAPLRTFPEIDFLEADETADLLDRATQCAQIQLDIALDEFQQRIIRQSAHAQERSQKGLAGICERCGKPIPKERLQARPDATRCKDCQVIYEKSAGRGKS